MAFVAANPDWTTSPYTAKGHIILPYGNIIEPFEAWVDPITKRSRIDYYNGMDSLFYLNGPGYKLVPSLPGSVSYWYSISKGKIKLSPLLRGETILVLAPFGWPQITR